MRRVKYPDTPPKGLEPQGQRREERCESTAAVWNWRDGMRQVPLVQSDELETGEALLVSSLERFPSCLQHGSTPNIGWCERRVDVHLAHLQHHTRVPRSRLCCCTNRSIADREFQNRCVSAQHAHFAMIGAVVMRPFRSTTHMLADQAHQGLLQVTRRPRVERDRLARHRGGDN